MERVQFVLHRFETEAIAGGLERDEDLVLRTGELDPLKLLLRGLGRFQDTDHLEPEMVGLDPLA